MAAGQAAGDPHRHVSFGPDHQIGADLLQHAGLQFARRLTHDLPAAHFFQEQRCENALLHACPDGHDDGIEVRDPDGAQGLGVCRVELHRMGGRVLHAAQGVLVPVDGQHVMPHFIERAHHGAAEPPDSDHGKVHADRLRHSRAIQYTGVPPATGSPPAAAAAPARRPPSADLRAQ